MTYRKVLYGYQICNGCPVLNLEEVPIVQSIFNLYQSGLSYRRISEHLNRLKLPYCTHRPIWNKNTVKRLLEDSRYIGNRGYPPIVTDEIFQSVQDIIQSKRPVCSTLSSTMKGIEISQKDTPLMYIPTKESIQKENIIKQCLESRTTFETYFQSVAEAAQTRYQHCVSEPHTEAVIL